MCVRAIIDSNMFGEMKGEPMRLFLDWIKRGDGILVYPKGKKVLEELKRSYKTLHFFLHCQRSGKTYSVKDDELQQACDSVDEDKLLSNDGDTVVLARASKAVVLCTVDKKLKQDFRNEIILPKVGKRKRAIYPREADAKTQRDFLQRRKCARVRE